MGLDGVGGSLVAGTVMLLLEKRIVRQVNGNPSGSFFFFSERSEHSSGYWSVYVDGIRTEFLTRWLFS